MISLPKNSLTGVALHRLIAVDSAVSGALDTPFSLSSINRPLFGKLPLHKLKPYNMDEEADGHDSAP
jgi:hypothetical protein